MGMAENTRERGREQAGMTREGRRTMEKVLENTVRDNMAMKPLLIKGQTGTFKPSIALSNLVLSIAFVGRPIQALDNFVSKFTLLTRKQ